MVTIQRSKFGLRITEVYFSDRPELPRQRSDVVMYVFARTSGPGLSELKTLMVDLNRDEDELLRDCSKTTRYSIKRAFEKDNLHVDFLISPDEKEVADFLTFYSVFAGQKERPMISTAKVSALQATEAFGLSVVKSEEGKALCYHAHLLDRETGRAMLLYSATHVKDVADSADRSLIGRANRFLHWMDLLSFRKHGFRLYDMGGLPPENSTKELQQIGDFKRTFGGTERPVYSGFRPKTLLGRLACFLVMKKVGR